MGDCIQKAFGETNNTWFLFDTIGLALFTVVGVEKTISSTPVTGGHYPFWAAIIMGAITGAGGGVLRDVFINEEPLISVKKSMPWHVLSADWLIIYAMSF